MQRYQCRLDAEPRDQQQEDHLQLRMVCLRKAVQCATLDKGRRSGQHVQPDGADEQQHTAAQGVGEIDACATHGLGCTAVGNQRVGRQCQQFVENDKGKQVACQRQSHGGRYTQAEETEKAAAMRRVFQIADGIDSGDQPQHGGEGHKQYRERVGVQHQVQTGCQSPATLVDLFVKYAPDQQAYQRELENGPSHVQHRAQPVAAFPQEEDDQTG